VAINIRWKFKHWAWTVGQSIISWLIFYSPAKQRETADENVKAPHNSNWTVTIHVTTNEYLEWMLLLQNSDYSAMKKTLKLNRVLAKIWASRHKIYITAIFTHLVSELCKNKNVRYWFKATLTLETRIGYISNTHSYQREICDGLEIKLT